MQETQTIQELVKYNLWANERLIRWLKTNDSVLLTKKCHSSFSNVVQTVSHILEGELLYYSLLEEQPVVRSWGDSSDDIFSGLIEQSEAFVDYVNHHQSFNELRPVKINALEGNFRQFELIQHCMNHSTFHRGQVITMGHQLQCTKAPSTDMLFYFIKRDNRRTTQ